MALNDLIPARKRDNYQFFQLILAERYKPAKISNDFNILKADK